ncbi:MAG: sigma-70 family RNA polymerase sigma factor [Pedobacter sp.]|nr:MAG: sigma-70 family RNA polymerase sigma factor [Pedobacter sp.]
MFLICKSTEVTEEVVQCVFIKIWERREMLGNVVSFQAYLYRSAKNRLLDYIKKTKTEARLLDTLQPISEESDDRADEHVNYKDFYEVAQQAINLLPEKRRQIVEMRTKEDLSLDEIALKLSISKSVVKKQLYSGMGFVKKYMQSHGELTATLLLFDYWIQIFRS